MSNNTGQSIVSDERLQELGEELVLKRERKAALLAEIRENEKSLSLEGLRELFPLDAPELTQQEWNRLFVKTCGMDVESNNE